MNDAPESNSDGESTISFIREDTSRTITTSQLLEGYEDADADQLSIVDAKLEITDTSKGEIQRNETSGWIFTPAKNYNGNVELIYRVTDGIASIDAKKLFTITPENDLPIHLGNTSSFPNGTEDRVYSITGLLDGIIDPDGMNYSSKI